MIKVLMTSTKPFEKKVFENITFEGCLANEKIKWDFVDIALNTKTAQVARGYSVVCVFVTDQIDKSCLQQLSSFGVKLIALRSAGFNHVDIDEAKKFGIAVVRVPKYSPHAVAEFAVALYLSLNRKLHKAYDRVKTHNFSLDGLVGHDIYLQTIGIIGCGSIGKCAAQIFKGFGSKVLACDPNPDQVWAKKNDIKYVDFDVLLSESDVISLHAPLNNQTKYLINKKAFSIMRKNSYLINTSRGALVETEALIQALKTKHLAGAALDVYEEEESIFFKDHSEDIIDDDKFAILNTFPNVLITSHQAFLTYEALNQISRTTINNITEWSEARELQNAL